MYHDSQQVHLTEELAILTMKIKCFQSTTSSTFLPYFFISRCFFAFSDLSIACCLLSNFALTWYEKGSWWKEFLLHCAHMTTKTIITQSTKLYLTQNINSQRIIILYNSKQYSTWTVTVNLIRQKTTVELSTILYPGGTIQDT